MPAHTAPPATPPNGLMGRQDLRTLIPELDQPEWLKAEYEAKGRRLQDIAVQLGCSRETVAKAVRDAGITIRTRQATPKTPPTPAEVEAAKAHLAGQGDALPIDPAGATGEVATLDAELAAIDELPRSASVTATRRAIANRSALLAAAASMPRCLAASPGVAVSPP